MCVQYVNMKSFTIEEERKRKQKRQGKRSRQRNDKEKPNENENDNERRRRLPQNMSTRKSEGEFQLWLLVDTPVVACVVFLRLLVVATMVVRGC